MTRGLALLFGLLGPLAVGAAAWSVLEGWEDWDDANAARNAGKILNSRVIERGVVEAMDVMLAQKQPEVLIIGPSYANTDVRPELLAARLGVPREKVLLLSVPNSVGAHWYAILKHRVFANGHRPKLVVVVSGLQSMLLNTPLTEASFVNLRVHLGDTPDPEIDARVKQTTSMRLARLREQRGKVKDTFFDALRFRPASALFRGQLGGPMSVQEIRGALDRVFDDAHVDMSLHMASTPIVEANRLDDRAYTPDMLPSPEASFIPVVTDLANEHGARMVWVRPPMSPHIPAHLDDVVLPGVQEATLALLSEHGADFVDMRALPMSAAMFKNEDHMNEEGSRRFSEALAKALAEIDALDPKARPDLVGPLAVQGRVEGAGRPLTDAEAALAREGSRWILPGERHVWTVAEWAPLRGAFSVALSALQMEAGAGASLSVAGVPLVFDRSGSDGIWRFSGEQRAVRPEGSFDVVVEVPPDGRALRLDALALGKALGRSFLHGDAAALEGHVAELFGVHRLADGAFVDHTLRPTFLKPPGRVPGWDRPITDLPGTMVAVFETERWAFLSDEALIGETNFGSRCSPLRITEGGRELPDANVPCLDVKRKGEGRSCHTTDRIFFAASDRTDPASNGRTYRLVLDEGRLCDGAVFLYPRDAFEVTFPADRMAGFTEPIEWFSLGANYLNQRPAEIRVVLTSGERVLLDRKVQGKDFEKGSMAFRLDPPLGPDTRDVKLSVENLASVFYLVTEASLRERPPAPGGR